MIRKEKPSLLSRIKRVFIPEQKPEPWAPAREMKHVQILTQLSIEVKAPVLVRTLALNVKVDRSSMIRKRNALTQLIKLGSAFLRDDEDDKLMTTQRQTTLKRVLKMGSAFLLDDEE